MARHDHCGCCTIDGSQVIELHGKVNSACIQLRFVTTGDRRVPSAFGLGVEIQRSLQRLAVYDVWIVGDGQHVATANLIPVDV